MDVVNDNSKSLSSQDDTTAIQRSSVTSTFCMHNAMSHCQNDKYFKSIHFANKYR